MRLYNILHKNSNFLFTVVTMFMVIIHLGITYMPIDVREYYFSKLSLEILHYSILTLMAMWSAYIVFTITI